MSLNFDRMLEEVLIEIGEQAAEEAISQMRNQGQEVRVKTRECQLWREKHSNCVGCPSELGCAKAAKLSQVFSIKMAFDFLSRVGFELQQKMLFHSKNCEGLSQKILQSKTLEELKKIPETDEKEFNKIVGKALEEALKQALQKNPSNLLPLFFKLIRNCGLEKENSKIKQLKGCFKIAKFLLGEEDIYLNFSLGIFDCLMIAIRVPIGIGFDFPCKGTGTIIGFIN